MAICIAKSKQTLAHYYFRVVPASRLHNMSEKDIIDLINDLNSAKSHKQLALATDGCCLLFDARQSTKQPKRVMSPSECIEALETDFEPVNPRLLAYELFMYSAKPLRANGSKESPAAVFDAYDSHFTRTLSQAKPTDCVIVEPVQDWMTFRNALALGSALLANVIAAEKSSDVLESSGFRLADRHNFKHPIYVAPFKFEAATFTADPSHPSVSSSLKTKDSDYLFSIYLWNSKNRKLGAGSAIAHEIGGDDAVFMATHYDATQKGVGLIDVLALPWEKNRNSYFCIRNEGSQVDMAKRAVEALWNASQTLCDHDTFLGMKPDRGSLFDPSKDSMTFSFGSLISKAWYLLFFHKGKRLTVCKHCGCGILGSNRGPAKEYCSDSCRVQE